MKINTSNIHTNQKQIIESIELNQLNNKKIIEYKENTFDNVFEQVMVGNVEVQLKEILSKLDKQKYNLIKEGSILEFRKYKSLVSDFISLFNSQNEIKERMFFDRYGNQKNLINIEQINEKLDELALKLKEDIKQDLEIIELSDEIKGLLVDTIM